MSQSVKLLVMVGLIGLVAACGRNRQEEVVIAPEPISEEPAQTGKFK